MSSSSKPIEYLNARKIKKTPKVILPVFSPEKLLGTFSIYHVDDVGDILNYCLNPKDDGRL